MAMSRLASLSTYTWQMPSAWPSTGILVLFWMCDTRELEPRGMTRSMTSLWDSRSATPSRLVTRLMRSRPTSGATSSMASTMIRCRISLLRVASLPPFSSSPFPDRMARLAICGSASGRASKMISTTPMGLDTFSNTSPSAISILLIWRPMGSSWAAMARMPAARACSLAGLSLRRCMRVLSILVEEAATSSSLAAMMSSSDASRLSATLCRIATRFEVSRLCRVREAARARRAASLALFFLAAASFSLLLCPLAAA
mmetsp:Transcript_6822/g.19669  ORF Transcript_6822/g.19669 Transcript_6822/m.19669 type:complete len:257 (-) Transcript_6822:1478-2248(-)